MKYVFGGVNSILRFQTATDFFTKTSSKRFMSNQERVGPYVLRKGYFGNFSHLKMSPGSFGCANGLVLSS